MGRHGTIAGRKAAQDSKRAAMFTKYAKAITVAAKDGGDPDYNASLRLAIEKAKDISMPNDNIQRAIKKGTGELGNVNFEEMSFEGYGLGGVAVIVDALTDNTNRTTSSVRSIFDKYGGNLGTPGCVSYMFSSKGVLVVDNEEGNLDEDTVMEDALEAGADDMVTGYEFVEADIEKVPSMEATPKPEDLKRLSRMINLLEENEDVQKVHHNCAVELVEE